MFQESQTTLVGGTSGALVPRRFDTFGAGMPNDAFATVVDLLGILRRRMWLIALTVAIVVSLASAYALLTTPIYTSSAQVLVDPRKKHTVDSEVVPSGIGENFALIDSQVQVMTSDAVLRPVVKRLHLANDPESMKQSLMGQVMGAIRSLFVVPETGNNNQEDKALRALRDRVSAAREAQTYVISISADSESAEKSARLAQAIAESYLADQSGDKAEMTQRAGSLMDGQLADLRERLREAEGKVQVFRAEHNLQEAEGELIDTRTLRDLNERLAAAKSEAAQTGAKYQQVEALLKSGVEPEMVGDAIESETIARLREQYAIAARREAILGASLLPSHPELAQARSEVERLRGLIRDEVERVASAIRLENEMAKQRLAKAKDAVSASRTETNLNARAEIKLRELEREAETTRAVYESFLSRVKEMNEAQRVYTPDARIISPASVPERPSWPKKRLILAFALVFGVGLGGALALGVEYLDRRIHSPEILTANTGLKLLASIPAVPVGRRQRLRIGRCRTGDASFYDLLTEILEGGPRSRFRGAVLRLLSHLVDFDTGGEPRVITLTSAVPGEGKSALALSLAVAAATEGMRTLLIDADTASPFLTNVFGVGDKGDTLGERIITDSELDLSFLSLRGRSVSLDGWSRRGALAEELNRITAGYDLTLIDAGLLRLERNAKAFVNASQAVLFLSRASSTHQETVAHAATDLLQMAQGRRCAAVLTMTAGGKS